MSNKKRPSLESTLKSSDTEEPIDIYFYRPIGYTWALFFRKLGITPNAVTIVSIFLGVGSGVCFYFENFWISLLGIFLLVWANSYDSADGQLARMTGKFSTFGRILDGFAGDIWFATIYISICLRLMPLWGSAWWAIWVLAIVAGIFHSKQASIADYYRNTHLLFLKGESGSELDSSKELAVKSKHLKWGKNFFDKLVAVFYCSYTRGQENWTPNLQEMFTTLKDTFGGNMPTSFRTEFRNRSLPLMKYTNILSFNVRSIALFISILIKQPWLYFIFELTVLNVLLVYMMRRHEKICKVFTKEIKEGKFSLDNAR